MSNGTVQAGVYKYATAVLILTAVILAIHGISIGRADASAFVLAQAAIMTVPLLVSVRLMNA